MKPQLFVLSGANGAGKTTYATEHVIPGTFIFNGDSVYARLLERYPDYDPEKLWGGVPQQMEKDIAQALNSKLHFAFETNYSSDMAADVTKTFIDAGYDANLIHFGLNNVIEASSRVDHRVSMGGHDLSPQEIEFNFNEGLKRIHSNLHLYETLKFIDTSIYGIAPIVAYFLKKPGKYVILNDNIKWFNEQFKTPVIQLGISRIEEISKELDRESFKKQNKNPDNDLNRGRGGHGISR